MSRTRSVGALALGLAATFSLAACTPSGTAFDGQAQSGSQQSGIEVSAGSVEQGSRATRFPLVAVEEEGLPFTLWLPEDTVGTVAVQDVVDVAAAVEGEDYLEGGTTEGEPVTVLALFDDGSAFVTGRSPNYSTEIVGVLVDGKFEPLPEFGVEVVTYLPEGTPYASLQASGAATWGPIVVWMSVGAGGKQWSLMSWNRETRVAVELASSSSMTLGFTGISARQTPDLAPPTLNGGYAYFDVTIPESLFDEAVPGVRFHELEQSESGDDSTGVATFRVPLTSPGDATFVGPSAQVIPDAGYGNGLFWVSSPLTDWDTAELDTLGVAQSGAQSGEGGDASWLQALSYLQVYRLATGDEPPRQGAPTFIVWGDADEVAPLFGFSPTDDWVLSDMAASEDFLVASITAAESLGAEGSSGESPASWLLAWDLAGDEMVAAIPSVAAVPSVSLSGDLVAWGALLDPESEGLDAPPHAYVWRIGSKEVYELPSEGDGYAPLLSGRTIATSQAGSSGTYWTFLTWLLGEVV